MGDTLTIGNGGWRVVVAPPLGGSLLACEYDDTAVLQPTAQPAGGGRPALRCCHFPLVPYSNRVEDSRFTFDGVPVTLARNVDGSPHAMHGHGWQSRWQLRESDAAGCTLAFTHEAAPDWPWAYAASQRIAVVGDALAITLAVENRGSAAMPCGLGFHPFLPKTPGARLGIDAALVWNRRAGDFPTEPVAVSARQCFRDAPRVAEREGSDHCFEDWGGRATVSDDDGPPAFRLDASEGARFVIVYIPAGDDYFCVEPVTHAVNAVNHADPERSGLWRLAPGEERRITLTIRPVVTPRD